MIEKRKRKKSRKRGDVFVPDFKPLSASELNEVEEGAYLTAAVTGCPEDEYLLRLIDEVRFWREVVRTYAS